MGDLIWAQAHKPKLPEKTYIRRVLPPAHQRDHWQERLGFDFEEGCYDVICKQVLKQINPLLEDTKWSSTERWMLETLKESTKPAPKWVDEIRGEKE